MTNSPKTPAGNAPADSAGGQKPKVTQEPNPTSAPETGGMIGEGSAGQPADEVTEDEPRTTRPGGMVGEG